MKVSSRNSKKIVILLTVIILVIISFFFFNKSKNNKISADNKNKTIIKTEELKKQALEKEALKKKELEKSNGKTSSGDVTTVPNKSTENKASADNNSIKETEKGTNTKVINKKEGFTVFVKEANFGSLATIQMDNGNTSYKYYQFFLGDKPISKIVSITNTQTTIFPSQKASSEVLLKLLDEKKKVIKELKIKLSEK